MCGALERTRTSDPQLRKLMLYPLSYERVKIQEDTFGEGIGCWVLGLGGFGFRELNTKNIQGHKES
jgi:hypothetical protein